MSQAQISLRIDAHLKEQADEVLKQMDSSPTQAITMLYHYIATNKKLPFAEIKQVKTHDETLEYVMTRFNTALETLLSIGGDILEKNGLDGKKLVIQTTHLRDIQGDVINHLISVDENERDALYLALTALNEATSACTGLLNFGFGMVTVKVKPDEEKRLAAAIDAFHARLNELAEDLEN
jgi:RHH-type rel operon transcriptional repressor/antitoxin RelB